MTIRVSTRKTIFEQKTRVAIYFAITCATVAIQPKIQDALNINTVYLAVQYRTELDY